LYVLRPVGRHAAEVDQPVWQMYSHGESAVESAVESAAETHDVIPANAVVSLRDVAALLREPGAVDVPTEVHLAREHGHLLVQVLLAARAQVHVLVCDNDTPGLRSATEQNDLRNALSGQYRVERLERSVDGGRASRLRLLRIDPADRSAWTAVSMRPHSKLLSSLADALIGSSMPDETTKLTKRTAKALARSLSAEFGLGDYRLLDLETACLLKLRARLIGFTSR
jgi:hypothetical protein